MQDKNSHGTGISALEEAAASRRVVSSSDLFLGTSELIIRHKEDYYRLMITKAGKLILNK